MANQRKPLLSDKVIRGIIQATSEMLAGPMDGLTEKQQDAVAAADEWAKDMHDYRARKKEKRTPTTER